MLIDKTGERWLIYTPCKSGCMSLEATLRFKVAHQIFGRHQLVTPPQVPVRILIVRHPIKRWESMYWFIRKHRGKSCYLQEFSDDIRVFAEEWDRRINEDHWWFYSLTKIRDVIQPTHVFRLEDDGVQQVCSLVESLEGVKLPVARHVNRNHHKGEAELPMDIIMKHWGIDLDNFYVG